jgi:phosphoglycolate phosphatase
MTYRHVIFDFDGTLADSWAAAVAIFARLAPRFRLTPLADPEAARTTPTRQLLKQMGVSFWTLPRLVRAFYEEAAGEADGLRLFDGLPATLAELAGRGHTLGVLSSNREDIIRRCLSANGVEDHFAFVVGYPKLFGKAKALRRILKAERADRGGVLYVGDEVRDMEAAAKARVAAAAVTWGFHAESLLAAARPTYLVRTPAELAGVLRGPGPCQTSIKSGSPAGPPPGI